LAGVLGIGEGHLLHRKTRRVIPGILSKSGSLLQDFLSRWSHSHALREIHCHHCTSFLLVVAKRRLDP
ncbi:hypothetical protein, partial [Pseudomonas putida]|uniref:hypothetical protein n=1 Tax=Pseudomonas putida TaxID=303 RepID=UPI002B253482